MGRFRRTPADLAEGERRSEIVRRASVAVGGQATLARMLGLSSQSSVYQYICGASRVPDRVLAVCEGLTNAD